MFDTTALFCQIDDLCSAFEPAYRKLLQTLNPKTRYRPASVCLSEILFIGVWFKSTTIPSFKTFFSLVLQPAQNLFSSLPCYARMIHLLNHHHLALSILHHLLAKQQSVNSPCFVDSTALPVCHNLRIQRHKTLKTIATRGKTSTGWFYGAKLHVLIDRTGQLIKTALTNGHVSDLSQVQALTEGTKGEVFGDRGYLSGPMAKRLRQQGLVLVTRVRKNMKALRLSKRRKYYLGKRNVVETVIGLLKQMNLVNTRVRSVKGWLAGVYSVLVAYQLRHKKPSISLFPH